MLSRYFKGLLLIFTLCQNVYGVEPSIDIYQNIPFSSSSEQAIVLCMSRSLDNGALKVELLDRLKKTFNVDTFVETGTYLGDTTAIAATIFKNVHTIELAAELYLRAVDRFKKLDHVTVHFGSSEDLFHSLLPNLQGRLLFYLDGHYSGHITARGKFDTPIIKELQAIKNAGHEDAILLIDDIRLFQKPFHYANTASYGMGLESYPELHYLVEAILETNPDYQICFLGDALLAYPKKDLVYVSPVMRACAIQRLSYLCKNLSQEELKSTIAIIGQAKDLEKQEIETYYQTYSPFEMYCGYRCFGALWQAAILLKTNKIAEGKELLYQVKEHTFPNWDVLRLMIE